MDSTNGAVYGTKPTAFLGRPAVVLTLGTDKGASGERSHKRSRPNKSGDAGEDDGAPGGIRQVVRSMLRAQKLGVLVPLVYDTDAAAGVALMEAVAGPRLAELMSAAVAAAIGTTTATTAATATTAMAGVEGLESILEQGQQQRRTEPGVAAAVRSVEEKPLPSDLDSAAILVGRTLSKLHDGGQVNNNVRGGTVVLRELDGAAVLTDFSRSFNTIVPLDKAQDLAAFEKALLEEAAAAPQVPELAVRLATKVFDKVLLSYRSSSRLWSATHNKLPEARRRESKGPAAATTTATETTVTATTAITEEQQQEANKRAKTGENRLGPQ